MRRKDFVQNINDSADFSLCCNFNNEGFVVKNKDDVSIYIEMDNIDKNDWGEIQSSLHKNYGDENTSRVDTEAYEPVSIFEDA